MPVTVLESLIWAEINSRPPNVRSRSLVNPSPWTVTAVPPAVGAVGRYTDAAFIGAAWTRIGEPGARIDRAGGGLPAGAEQEQCGQDPHGSVSLTVRS